MKIKDHLTCQTGSDVFYLSRDPMPLTPDDVGLLLKKVQDDHNDIASKKIIISLIEHRLNHRYIRPLSHVPVEPIDYKSGFLMMAVACLLIETLYSFRKGINDTDRKSEDAFKDFFTDYRDSFKEFDECFPRGYTGKDGKWKKDGCSFYKHIRCGILHQAETTGGYRILRMGELFDSKKNAVNANKFVEELEKCIDKYIGELHRNNCGDDPWPKAIDKLGFICKNCKKQKNG
jgi:hypothetical protein